MANDLATEFAHCQRGRIEAPAGCGKTHLIADAVSVSRGRQLILTHTHAGVRAILNHLRRRGIPSRHYHVHTLDGFALRYANSYPQIAEWSCQCPKDDGWKDLPAAYARVLRRSAIKKVLATSYSGLFVDEYQDCSAGQHDFVVALADVLPCRIVGDPMQAVFRELNKDRHCDWSTVESCFNRLGPLDTPHRWATKNKDLGQWLMKQREFLMRGEPIDLRGSPANWVERCEHKDHMEMCFASIGQTSDTCVALRRLGKQCHYLARYVKGRFHTMETVECEDLLIWAERIENASSINRISAVVEFAKVCISRLPTAIKDLPEKFRGGKIPRSTKPDYQRVINALRQCLQNDDLQCVAQVMDSLDALIGIGYPRREVWREMRRSLLQHVDRTDRSLGETAWHIRNRSRVIGRRVDQRCIATPLLVKGLEFDHAIILNAADHNSAEHLYVAMTRGSKSLTVLSDSPILWRAPPCFLGGTPKPISRRSRSAAAVSPIVG